MINPKANSLPVPSLYADQLRTAATGYQPAEEKLAPGHELITALHFLADRLQTDLYTVCIAAVKVLLYRYTGQDDMVVALVHKKEHAVLLQTCCQPGQGFLSFAGQVKEAIGSADEEAGQGLNVLIVTGPMDRYAADDKDSFDLLLSIHDRVDALTFTIRYNSCLFGAARMRRMTGHLQQLLQHLSVDPATPVSRLSLLADEEWIALLREEEPVALPSFTSIQAWIEDTAATYPTAIAVVCEERRFTYAELNEKANQLAAFLLQEAEVQPGSLAGILLHRNEWMIVALLGVLKAGVAYLPVDPAYPADRIRYMLADSGADIVITERTLAGLPALHNSKTICLDEITEQLAGYDAQDPAPADRLAAPAYVIYTSGSTGKPKGVVITHSNVISLLVWAHREYDLSLFQTVFATTSYCFDLSVFEMFFSLSAGKSVRVLQSGLDIPEYCLEDEAILVNTVPSVVDTLLKIKMDWSRITVLNMAGEPISLHIKQALDCNRIEVRNLYGPSEDTTYSSCYRFIAADETIPIGRPICNTSFFIVDKALHLLPMGVPGEIAIAGMGLANGYLNRPELTDLRFTQQAASIGKRVYLTGDIGVRREDGQFEYLGRSDNQVKIRGYRIELGEVEQAVLRKEGVRQALVVARSHADGEKYLALYYTGTAMPEEALQAFMAESLAEYMVPARFIHLDAFPLTVNGKIDRNQLPDPMAAPAHEEESDTIINEGETRLLVIWQQVFQRHAIGIDDDFFALGGHSLKAVRIIAALAQSGTVIDLHEVFNHPTIRDLSAFIAQQNGSVYQPVTAVQAADTYELSYDQAGLWLAEQLNEGLSAYNIPYTYRICGRIDYACICQAFALMIDRHEVLRTVFVMRNGEARQHIRPATAYPFQVTYEDFSVAGETIALDFINRQHLRSFDLASGPLIRGTLVRLADDVHLFAFTIHHILFDDWSNDVFKTEFYQLYTGLLQGKPVALPAPAFQYKDYAAWLRQRLGSGRMTMLENYWLTVFENGITPVALETDHPRQPAKTFDGDFETIVFDPAFTRRLLDTAAALETTLFTLLLGGVKSWLYLHTGQEDIAVATPVAQRLQPEWHDQLGIYSNIIVLRTLFSGDDRFTDFIGKLKGGLMEAHQHHDYPFFSLTEALQSRLGDAWQTFNVMMTMQEEELLEMDRAWRSLPVPCTGVKAELEFNFVLRTDQQLQLNLGYNTHLFRQESMNRLVRQLELLLDHVTMDPQKRLDQLAFQTLRKIQSPSPQPKPPARGRTATIPAPGNKPAVKPVNETETALLNIWVDIFQRPGISTSDHFMRLGGHSIKAMQIKAKIAQLMGAEIAIADVFKYHSVQLLAAHLRSRQDHAVKPAGQAKYAAIKRAEKREYYPLSSIQRPLYMVQQIYPDSIAYNIVDTIPVQGDVDPLFIESVVQKLIERHEVFRTSFRKADGIPVQVVQEKAAFRMQFYTSTESSMAGLMRNIVKPFDLAEAPLLRLFYVTGTIGPLFLIDVHHIISDALSVRRFYEEVQQLAQGEVPAPPIHYKDFSLWLDKNKKKAWMQEQADFWRSQFSGEIPVLQLPADFPRPKIKTYNGRVHQFALGKKSIGPVQVFCRLHHTSLFTALLSAYYILLSKLSGQKDIIVGVPSTFRNNPDLKTMQGMFVNTLPVRLRIESHHSFTDVLLNVRSVMLKALDQQDYQPDDLISSLSLARDSSRSPLYDVLFNMLNQLEISLNMEDALEDKVNHYDGVISAQFDLILQAVERNSDVVFAFSYNTDLFKAQTIERFSQYFKNILASVMRHPRHPVSRLDYLPAAEKEALLAACYQPGAYSLDQTIVGMMEDAVQAGPEKTAVICGRDRLSFRELDEQAGRLAAIILQQNTGRHRFIPLLLKRDLYMPVAIWGVLKAGLAFVPVSPDWPSERISAILNDLGSDLLVTNLDQVPQSEDWPVRLLIPAGPHTGEERVHTTLINPDDPVYTVYTSGTTGRPKGAINLHRALANRLQYLDRRYPPASDEVMLLTNNYVFDSALYQILWPLAAGFQLIVPEAGAHFDLKQMTGLMKKHRVTMADFVPSVLAVLADMMDEPGVTASMQSLRNLIVGGEAMHAQVAYRIKSKLPGLTITNDYGPTEAAVSTVFYELPDEPVNPVPIGKPMDNVRVIILDEDESMVPAGVAGELYLGGACTGSGYLNAPEQTARAFRMVQVPGWGKQLFYKTGDRVKLGADGNLHFLGRIDNQVKIRGFRIEPEEIKAVLQQHPLVKEAAVIVYREEGDPFLAAYYTGDAGVENELRTWLSAKLPEYMVPACIMHLESFPIAGMGKLDMAKLPRPVLHSQASVVAPRNETEQRLLVIWQKLLEKETIGVLDDFFLAGGHSLRAIQLNHRIQREFDIALSLNDIFGNPTIAGLAAVLQLHVHQRSSRIPLVEKKNYYPASNGQKRIWFIEQFDETSGAYNIPAQFTLAGTCNSEALQDALHAVIARHESLRTSFFEKDGFPMQRVHAVGAYRLPFEQLDLSGKKEQAFLQYLRTEISRPFDLGRAPLLRVKLLHREERSTILLTIHHIIADGWSADVLLKELLHYYNNYEYKMQVALPALPVQYKDFANWQASRQRQQELHVHQQYWLSRFSKQVPILNLLTDFERPAVQTFGGEEMAFFLDAPLCNRIRQLSRQSGATVFMTLTALLNTLLARYSGREQEDIVLGLPVAGREVADLESQIGFYTNTLAIRTRFSQQDSFHQLLANVKSSMVDAYDHQAYPFDLLVEDLQYPRDISRNPVFDIMITGTVREQESAGDAATTVDPVYRGECTSKFDLSFEFTEYRDAIGLQVVFNTALFTRERIGNMIRDYRTVADHFTLYPGQPVAHVQVTAAGTVIGIEKDNHRTIEQEPGFGYADPVEEPDDSMEALVTGIWEEVLHTRGIRRTDNFFTLGGNSLKTLQVQARIYQKLGVRIKVKELFLHATIRQLAARLNEQCMPAPLVDDTIEIEISE